MIRIAAVIGALVLCAASAHRQLAPGETECTSTRNFGVMSTHCRTGQNAPDPGPPPGWWCSWRSDDGFGVCFRGAGECVQRRGDGFGECRWQSVAICSTSQGCYVTPADCAKMLIFVGGNVADCRAVP